MEEWKYEDGYLIVGDERYKVNEIEDDCIHLTDKNGNKFCVGFNT